MPMNHRFVNLRVILWKRNTVIEGDCWRYKAQQKRPTTEWKGKRVNLSRISAHIFLGLDLDDPKQQANHKPICKHKDCWNPDHLYVGTQKQNLRDRREARKD